MSDLADGLYHLYFITVRLNANLTDDPRDGKPPTESTYDKPIKLALDTTRNPIVRGALTS